MMRSLLVVDDQNDIRNRMVAMMSGEECLVHTARSAQEGLAILARRSCMVVMSGPLQSGMPGPEFLTVARKRHPQLVRIMRSSAAEYDLMTSAVHKGEAYRLIDCKWDDAAIRRALGVAFAKYESEVKLRAADSFGISLLDEKWRLELEYPGITRVRKDRTGRLVLRDRNSAEQDALYKGLLNYAH